MNNAQFDLREENMFVTNTEEKGVLNTEVDYKNMIEKRIVDIFLSIGISAHLQGYQYLKESIKLVMREPECINSVTKKMYPKIADTFFSEKTIAYLKKYEPIGARDLGTLKLLESKGIKSWFRRE